MREKAVFPVGLVAVGISLIGLGWLTGLSVIGAGIGCLAAGLLTLAWRTGRHYACG